MTKKIDPFWLMLAVNTEKERVTVLGISVKPESEALEIAKSRAGDDKVRVFAMHNDANAIGTAMKTWFQELGISEDYATQLVRDVAAKIATGMEAARPRHK